MSSGLYTHTTRAVGIILTANIYNADHQNHIDNHNPSKMGGFSDTVNQMQSTANPGDVGTENLAETLAHELRRLRFVISRIVGKTHWYEPPDRDLATPFADSNGTFTSQTGNNNDPAVRVAGGRFFNLDWADNLSGLTADLRIGRSTTAGVVVLSIYDPGTANEAMRLQVNSGGVAIVGGNIIASNAEMLAGVRNDKIATPLRVQQAIDARAVLAAFFIAQDQRAAGVNGGTFNSGSWLARTLNTTVHNSISGASRNGNNIVLPAGSYIVRAMASTGLGVAHHRVRFRNVTDGVTVVTGINERAGSGASLEGRFTITAQKQFQLQHICTNSETGSGFGGAVNLGTEIYSNVFVWKVG